MDFQVPPSDWLPLSKGLFRFHFSPGWKDATPEQLLSSILFRLCEEHPAVHADLDESTITVSRRHNEGGKVWLETIGSYTIEDGFKYDTWLREVPPEDFRNAVSSVMTGFIERTERAFRKQHAAGRCMIYARVGTPLETAFSTIPPDVFTHFNVQDWRKGMAVSDAGEKLFSIHAALPSEVECDAGTAQAMRRKALTKSQRIAMWIVEKRIKRDDATLDGHIKAYLESVGAGKDATLDHDTMRKAFREASGDY